jgi:hypothetical protein
LRRMLCEQREMNWKKGNLFPVLTREPPTMRSG